MAAEDRARRAPVVEGIFVRAEIPAEAKVLLNDLRILQAQIEALPGPRMHQDHDFVGEAEQLEVLFGWLQETLWVPYWGQPGRDADPMLFLGGRDPWIWTLEERLWMILSKLAGVAGCELTGRGSVSPEDEELEVIHTLLPVIAEAQGWEFQRDTEMYLQ